MNSPRHRDSLQQLGRGVQRATLRRKRMHTIFICLSFVSLGINSAIVGPTFLDILQILNVSVEGGSPLFTSSSVGYLFGSLLCGYALEIMNQEVFLFASMIGMAVFTIIMPWIASLPLVALAIAMGRVFSASINTGCNAVCLQIWGSDVRPYMQMIHFAFALGGSLAPMIAQPFLVERYNVSPAPGNGSTSDTDLATVMLKEVCEDNKCMPRQQPKTHVQFAFLIAGSTAILISFTFLYMYFKYKRRVKRIRTPKQDTEPKLELKLISKILYLVLLTKFFAFYCGVEDTFANFLATFIVKYSGWSKSAAANVTSVFWGAFALAHLLYIFIAKIISPWKMVVVDCVVILISLSLLYFLTHVTAILWTSSALMGISMASIFPSICTWTELKIMHVSGRITSLFLISGSFGRMCNPLIVGYLFDHITPIWFLRLLLGETILCVLVFGVLSICVKIHYGQIFVVRQSKPIDITVGEGLLEEQHIPQLIAIDGSDPSP